MAGGDHDQATLGRYADAQARLEHAGGYAWRDRAAGVVRGLGFTDADLDRPLETFSGGELTRASLARALGGRPGSAAARRADEPPRRREPRVARAGAAVARRRGDPRRARPLVPRGGDERACSSSRRGRSTLLRRARGTSGGARRLLARCTRRRLSTRRRRHRAARALRRALPVQEDQGEAGAGEAHADRPAREGARRPAESSTPDAGRGRWASSS